MNDWQLLGLTYLVTVNIAGAVIAAADKRKAQRKAWRIPEKAFLLLSLLGGGAGVLAGFLLFRHKTRHFGLMAGVIALTVAFWAVFIAVGSLLL